MQVGSDTTHSIELFVSDPAELRSLRQHLRQLRDVRVMQVPQATEPYEQGAWDVLQVAAASGGALVIAIKTIPAFLQSRRSNVTVTVKTKGKTITVTATNVEDVMPVVEKTLDA